MLFKRPNYKRFDPPLRYHDPSKEERQKTKIRFSKSRVRSKKSNIMVSALLFAAVLYVIFYLSQRF
ncbi:MAG: hypothetical protein LCH54_08010 [Bacteroidetes bacterium]|nr:hypothetical protein [Bacteroidota bacterium]MCA0446158.1 hypothetical protein [Bacteroidota bacterium]